MATTAPLVHFVASWALWNLWYERLNSGAKLEKKNPRQPFWRNSFFLFDGVYLAGDESFSSHECSFIAQKCVKMPSQEANYVTDLVIEFITNKKPHEVVHSVRHEHNSVRHIGFIHDTTRLQHDIILRHHLHHHRRYSSMTGRESSRWWLGSSARPAIEPWTSWLHPN